MKVLITIMRLELLQLWRDGTSRVLGLLLLVLTVYAVGSSTSGYSEAEREHHQLTETARDKMVHQKPASPHMAGHYGHIAFKPATFLQAVDPGVNVFTGTTVRVEAHTQNRDVFAPAGGRSSLVRFGEFSFSLLLQVVVPLLILFTCYRSILADRANGSLKILLCQGISMRMLVLGRASAYSGVFVGYLLLAAAGYGAVFLLRHEGAGDGDGILLRLLALVLLYALYYMLLVGSVVFASALSRDASGLLAGLLAVWLIITIILPKAAANIGEQHAPLPTSLEFAEGISSRKGDGINGHDRSNPHTVAFIDSVKRAYGVDSVEALPVKIGGLLMQADEDYNNRLYDEALGGIEAIIARQNRIGSLSAYLNPFMAVRNLSMALAGTDMHQHFHFTESVELYRRELVATLNAQDALRESAYKDGKGKLTGRFWESSADFEYAPPSLSWSLGYYVHELVALSLWCFLVFFMIYFLSNKIRVS